MRKLLLSTILATAAATSLAADNVVLTGQWKLHQSVMGNDSDSACTFTQKDNSFVGSCTSDTGSGKVAGKVEGKKVSWSFETEYNGSPLTVKFTGTVDDAGKIAGAVNVEQFGVEGDFTASPVK